MELPETKVEYEMRLTPRERVTLTRRRVGQHIRERRQQTFGWLWWAWLRLRVWLAARWRSVKVALGRAWRRLRGGRG